MELNDIVIVMWQGKLFIGKFQSDAHSLGGGGGELKLLAPRIVVASPPDKQGGVQLSMQAMIGEPNELVLKYGADGLMYYSVSLEGMRNAYLEVTTGLTLMKRKLN